MDVDAMDVDAMDAGPDLDAAVHGALHQRHNVTTDDRGAVYCSGWHERSAGCDYRPTPRYSTEPVLAVGVVADELARRGWRLVLEDWRRGDIYPDGPDGWMAMFLGAGGHSTGQCVAPTPALAVARAALKAVAAGRGAT